MANTLLQSCVENLASIIGEKVADEASLVFNLREYFASFKTEIEDLQGYLADAEEKAKAGGDSKRMIERWIAGLEEAVYSAEYIFDECLLYDIQKASKTQSIIHSHCIQRFWFCRKMEGEIKSINQKISSIKQDAMAILTKVDANNQHVSVDFYNDDMPILYDKGVGMEERLNQAFQILENARGVSVVGIGGLGKTFLLKNIFNCKRSLEYYNSRVWLCVSRNCSLNDLQQSIWYQIKGSGEPDLYDGLSLDAAQQQISHRLSQIEKWLIVIDDVWREDDELLRHLGIPRNKDGCHVLLSTRDKRVATEQIKWIENNYIHEMKELREDESWELFCQIIKVVPGTEVEDVAKEIVKLCKNHPLTIKATAASMLGIKSRLDWEKKLKALQSLSNPAKDDPHEKVLNRLQLSFDSLPTSVKPCFVYLAMFDEDSETRWIDIIRRWVEEGFVATQGTTHVFDRAEEHLQLLCQKCLVEVFEDGDARKKCKMHDLMHELACRLFQKNKGYCMRKEMGFMMIDGMDKHLSHNMEDYRIMKVYVTRSCSTSIPFPNYLHSLDAEFHEDKTLGINGKALRVLRLNTAGYKKQPKWYGKGLKQKQYLMGHVIISGAKLEHLRCLHISIAKMEAVPNCVRRMKLLTSLSVGWLHELPKWIGELQYLQQFRFWSTVDAPKELKKLTKLVSIRGRLRLLNGPEFMSVNDLSVFVELKKGDFVFNGQIHNLPFLSKVNRLTLANYEAYLDITDDVASRIPKVVNLDLYHFHVPRCLHCFQGLERLTIGDVGDATGFNGSGVERIPSLKYFCVWNEKRSLIVPQEWGSTAAFPALQVLELNMITLEESFKATSEGCMRNLKKISFFQILFKAHFELPKRIFQLKYWRGCEGLEYLSEF